MHNHTSPTCQCISFDTSGVPLVGLPSKSIRSCSLRKAASTLWLKYGTLNEKKISPTSGQDLPVTCDSPRGEYLRWRPCLRPGPDRSSFPWTSVWWWSHGSWRGPWLAARRPPLSVVTPLRAWAQSPLLSTTNTTDYECTVERQVWAHSNAPTVYCPQWNCWNTKVQLKIQVSRSNF